GRTLDLLYRFINFTLLVIILVVVVKKAKIGGFFSSRIEEIKKKFDDLNAEKDTSEGRFQELEKKLKEFEVKKQEIIEQFKVDGEAEKEKIIAEARERANQILIQADLTIEREIQAARDRLRQEVVEVAARNAQEIIEREIKDGDQDHLVARPIPNFFMLFQISCFPWRTGKRSLKSFLVRAVFPMWSKTF
ncbi:MAG: ATP synthase F0 subunit B, partial [Deltaproteobacteria bacterium]|nr:ATP synthase F0 subunit B [Deltaproteobacteria bacterium]